MYLTRIELDTTSKRTKAALASPAILHGAIEGITASKGGKLWRIDDIAGAKILLISSLEKPNIESVDMQFGTGNYKTVDYDRFLQSIKTGQMRRFRIQANPIRRVGGKKYALQSTDEQIDWIVRQADENGFKIDKEKICITDSTWLSFSKSETAPSADDFFAHASKSMETVRFKSVIFEGICSVYDAEKVKNAIRYGIGAEKAYGCGMLSLTQPFC